MNSCFIFLAVLGDIGNFKDVWFYSILNVGHFGVLSLVTLLTIQNVINPKPLTP